MNHFQKQKKRGGGPDSGDLKVIKTLKDLFVNANNENILVFQNKSGMREEN